MATGKGNLPPYDMSSGPMPSQSGSTNVHVLGVITIAIGLLLLTGTRPKKWDDRATVMGGTAADTWTSASADFPVHESASNSRPTLLPSTHGAVPSAAANTSNIRARPTCVYSYFYTPANRHGMGPAASASPARRGEPAPALHDHHPQPYVYAA